MITQSNGVSTRNPVRWPFRAVAALIVVAGLVAVVGVGLAWWSHGAGSPKWQMLYALPGIAWLIRSAWEAAIHGRSPTSECWPFASQRVFTWYVVILLVASYT
jgi:hypothetical protein